MSTIKAAADREAEEAERAAEEEAERQEAEHGGAVDLDRIAEEGPSEEQMAAVQAENERHLTELRTIMGPAFLLFEECGHCDGIGIKPRGPEPVQYERYRKCPTCEGFGQVLTGAQPTAHATVSCPSCGGRGYQEKLEAQLPAGTPPPPVTTPPATDEWGVPSWMGDPHIAPPPPPVTG